GYCYQQAKKDELAYKNYKRLADKKVSGNDDYKIVYSFLLLNDIKTKNKAEFDDFLKTAKSIFPKENWDQYEAEYVDKNFSF
ncbi:hypothetical protein ABTE27_23380, partial [Acinetobacter baumannii]